MSSELAKWTNSQTTTLEKRKTALESSRKNEGEYPEESTGVFDRPTEQIAGFRQETLGPSRISRNSWPKHINMYSKLSSYNDIRLYHCTRGQAKQAMVELPVSCSYNNLPKTAQLGTVMLLLLHDMIQTTAVCCVLSSH